MHDARPGTTFPSSNPLDMHSKLPTLTSPPGPDALAFSAITPHGPGFQNAGNTCFANSTLQALLHSPALLHIVQAHQPRAHAHGRGSGFCALCSLKALSRHVHSSSGHRLIAIMPSSFVEGRNLRQISRTFHQYRQEDAHEFLRGLLDSATRSALVGCGAPLPAHGGPPLSHAREMASAVHSACGGVLQSGVTCHSCGYESVTLEPFLDVSIGTAPTVERSLARFTAPDRLEGSNMYRCDSCRKRVVASKRLSVRTAPNTLTIHLKRFNGMKKDRTNVKYPARLDLSPYMVKGMSCAKPVVYNLTAVLVHDGHGTRSGHYYSYVKGSNGIWCQKNDALSSTVSEARALQQQAYILFYSLDPSCVLRVEKPDVAPRPVVAANVVKNDELLAAKASPFVDSTFPPSNPKPEAVSLAKPEVVPTAKHQVAVRRAVENSIDTPFSASRPQSPESSTDVDMSSKDGDWSSRDECDIDSSDGQKGTVDAFISGGSKFVKKLARRILNYVGTASEDKDMMASEPNGPFLHFERMRTNPLVTPNVSPEGRTEEQTASGIVFRDRGVAGWVEGEAPKWDELPMRSKLMQKRARAQDAADADYDRGRPKKVRQSPGNIGAARGKVGGENPFTASACASSLRSNW